MRNLSKSGTLTSEIMSQRILDVTVKFLIAKQKLYVEHVCFARCEHPHGTLLGQEGVYESDLMTSKFSLAARRKHTHSQELQPRSGGSSAVTHPSWFSSVTNPRLFQTHSTLRETGSQSPAAQHKHPVCYTLSPTPEHKGHIQPVNQDKV